MSISENKHTGHPLHAKISLTRPEAYFLKKLLGLSIYEDKSSPFVDKERLYGKLNMAWAGTDPDTLDEFDVERIESE